VPRTMGIVPDIMENLAREKECSMAGSVETVHLFGRLKQTVVKLVGRCIHAALQHNARTTASIHRTRRSQLCCGMKVYS
jgi:hypothetical protein